MYLPVRRHTSDVGDDGETVYGLARIVKQKSMQAQRRNQAAITRSRLESLRYRWRNVRDHLRRGRVVLVHWRWEDLTK